MTTINGVPEHLFIASCLVSSMPISCPVLSEEKVVDCFPKRCEMSKFVLPTTLTQGYDGAPVRKHCIGSSPFSANEMTLSFNGILTGLLEVSPCLDTEIVSVQFQQSGMDVTLPLIKSLQERHMQGENVGFVKGETSLFFVNIEEKLVAVYTGCNLWSPWGKDKENEWTIWFEPDLKDRGHPYYRPTSVFTRVVKQ